MPNEIYVFPQSETSTEKYQSSFHNFKTSATVVVTVILLSTSSQITSVIPTGSKSYKPKVVNTHASTQIFYNEDLRNSHFYFSEDVIDSVEKYHVITEEKPMKNSEYSIFMNYVQFMNTLGWLMGTGLLLCGLFVFKLPVINSVIISLGGFVLPFLTRISGVHKYARK